MRVILRYEGEGRARRAVWSENQPATPMQSRRQNGSLVVGDNRSAAERHRDEQRRHKARKAAQA